MKPNYKKLWKLMIDRDMSKADLRRITGMSATTMAKLGKGEDVSMALLRKVCEVLHCNIGDVMEFVPNHRSPDDLSAIELRQTTKYN